MESELNRKLVTTILKKIPKNKKIVSYIVRLLSISRESAYRRIRGDIPFTVQELIKLAADLEFSIDEVYEQEKQNHAFYDYTEAKKNSNDFFFTALKKYDELFEKVKNTGKVECMMAFNSFPPPFFIDYFHLFRFTYYKWLCQDNEIFQNKSYSEMIFPDETIAFQKKMQNQMVQGENIILILDMNIFLDLMKEIQYFYQRKLLTDEELFLLKEDILHLIEQYEKTVQTGVFGTVKVQLYLSSLCINSNTVCYRYNGKVESLFWIFTINPVIIQNTEFASMQTKWLNFLRRQSALITQSNEIMQTEFFTKQRDYLDKYLSINNVMI